MNIWSILCLIWTLVAYVVAKRIYQKNPKLWLSPAISVPVLTIILMTIFGISYQTYAEDTQWIVNLLGPATVALLYQFIAIGKQFVKPWGSFDCDYCGYECRCDVCL